MGNNFAIEHITRVTMGECETVYTIGPEYAEPDSYITITKSHGGDNEVSFAIPKMDLKALVAGIQDNITIIEKNNPGFFDDIDDSPDHVF